MLMNSLTGRIGRLMGQNDRYRGDARLFGGVIAEFGNEGGAKDRFLQWMSIGTVPIL